MLAVPAISKQIAVGALEGLGDEVGRGGRVGKGDLAPSHA